jgi:putative FmdB family regulatory protein
MPIFDYRCKNCGNEFESIVLRDTDKVLCEKCGSALLEKKTISLFTCTTMQLNKSLKLKDEQTIKQGQAWMAKQKQRKGRIKIL